MENSEKEKIKAEEIYRIQIRKEIIDANEKSKKGFLGFLNSAFGIWVLSTVVIGLFTYFFNEYNLNKTRKELRHTKIQQLDLEIASRISQFWVHLYPIVEKKDSIYLLKPGISSDTIKVLWNAFKNPPSYNPKLTSYNYKEYEGRNIISLMMELKTALEEEYHIKTEIKKPMLRNKSTVININEIKDTSMIPFSQEIDKINTAAILIADDALFDYRSNPSIQEIWNFFNEKIIIRWDNFPYTDCLFC